MSLISFSPNTPIKSADVDANFTGLANGTLITAPYNNPYKFRVYRAAGTNTGAAAFALVPFDTKTYDTSSNVDIVTNKGRFTAPVNGFYQFNARVQTTQGSGNNRFAMDLYKNGAAISNGPDGDANDMGGNVGDILQLVAGDYIEVFAFGATALAINVGAAVCYFSGFLVSQV